MVQKIIQPAIWLIVIITALPQMAETIYTPSLPQIARYFNVEEYLVEYTLTVYLLGFAAGVFFWGNLSDKTGRKPCMIAGFILFILGCLGSYLSASIEIMLLSRILQGFGGAVSSVLGQAMVRDVFKGPELGRVYATVGAALSISPAIGPFLGGTITQYFSWQAIFLTLIILAIIVTTISIFKLPETHFKSSEDKISMLKIFKQLMGDKHVWGCVVIVAMTNGILFSYYGEGSFYLIDRLGLTPKKYGLTFVLIAAAGFSGALYARRLLKKEIHNRDIVFKGIMVMIMAMILFTISILTLHFLEASKPTFITFTLLSMILSAFGSAMATSIALGWALIHYQQAIGTASSIFGLTYYAAISLATYGMAYFHHDSLFPMPIYFLTVSVFGLVLSKKLLSKN